MDILNWLEKWYLSMCDGSWEHSYGVSIDTLDNPGWTVSIDILDTPLEHKNFHTISRDIDENDWIHCQVKDGKFKGAGDPTKLVEILSMFRSFVES